jgi:hypothetical protein
MDFENTYKSTDPCECLDILLVENNKGNIKRDRKQGEKWREKSRPSMSIVKMLPLYIKKIDREGLEVFMKWNYVTGSNVD